MLATESYSRRSVRRNPCLKIIVYRTLMWNINNVQLDQKLGSFLIYWLQVNTGVIISSQHHRTKGQNKDNTMMPFFQKGKMAITIKAKHLLTNFSWKLKKIKEKPNFWLHTRMYHCYPNPKKIFPITNRKSW